MLFRPTPRTSNLEILDLSRAPYVSYGVKFIDLVSLDATTPWRPVNLKLLDLGRAPYVLYRVEYIHPVSPRGGSGEHLLISN